MRHSAVRQYYSVPARDVHRARHVREVSRERMTPILFETFNVSAIYVAIQAVLSLCGSLHRDETCLLFRLKRLFRWPLRQFLWRPRRWRHPQCTPHKGQLSSTLLQILPVSYAATAPIVEYVPPAPAGSYVAPEPVVDTTRPFQWCFLLRGARRRLCRACSCRVRGASASG